MVEKGTARRAGEPPCGKDTRVTQSIVSYTHADAWRDRQSDTIPMRLSGLLSYYAAA